MLYNVVYKMPRRRSALAALPDDVDDALAVAIAKNPDDRFFTAGELAGALDDALDGKLADGWRAQARRGV